MNWNTVGKNAIGFVTLSFVLGDDFNISLFRTEVLLTDNANNSLDMIDGYIMIITLNFIEPTWYKQFYTFELTRSSWVLSTSCITSLGSITSPISPWTWRRSCAWWRSSRRRPRRRRSRRRRPRRRRRWRRRRCHHWWQRTSPGMITIRRIWISVSRHCWCRISVSRWRRWWLLGLLGICRSSVSRRGRSARICS